MKPSKSQLAAHGLATCKLHYSLTLLQLVPHVLECPIVVDWSAFFPWVGTITTTASFYYVACRSPNHIKRELGHLMRLEVTALSVGANSCG